MAADPFNSIQKVQRDLLQLTDSQKSTIIDSLEQIGRVDLSKRGKFLRCIERILRATKTEIELIPGGQRARKVGFTYVGGEKAEFLCGDQWLTKEMANALSLRIVEKAKARRSQSPKLPTVI
jgi:hypothetical protein